MCLHVCMCAAGRRYQHVLVVLVDSCWYCLPLKFKSEQPCAPSKKASGHARHTCAPDAHLEGLFVETLERLPNKYRGSAYFLDDDLEGDSGSHGQSLPCKQHFQLPSQIPEPVHVCIEPGLGSAGISLCFAMLSWLDSAAALLAKSSAFDEGMHCPARVHQVH